MKMLSRRLLPLFFSVGVFLVSGQPLGSHSALVSTARADSNCGISHWYVPCTCYPGKNTDGETCTVELQSSATCKVVSGRNDACKDGSDPPCWENGTCNNGPPATGENGVNDNPDGGAGS